MALKYLEKANSIYPYSNNSRVLLGNTLAFYQKDYKGAIDQYMKVLSFDANDKIAYGNLFKVLAMVDDAKETTFKLNIFLNLNKLRPDNLETNSLLGKLYGQHRGNLDSAAYFLINATRLAPENPAAYKDLGIVYGLQKNYTNSLQAFQTALKLDPNDQQTRQNIAVTYSLIEQNRRKTN